MKKSESTGALVVKDCRRSRRPPQYAQRWEITTGRKPPPGRYLYDMLALDKRLELFWHPGTGRWVLYRMRFRKAARAEEEFVLQLVLRGENNQYREPGGWLVDTLQRTDVYRRYGHLDREGAKRAYLKELRDKEESRDSEKDKKAADLAHQYAKDCFKAIHKPSSVVNNWKGSGK